MPQQQALTRRDFASEADWQEYQATGMAPRQLEGRAKVVSRGAAGQGEGGMGETRGGMRSSGDARVALSERSGRWLSCGCEEPLCWAGPDIAQLPCCLRLDGGALPALQAA